MENIVLWHERDISHSSVERIIGPDATIALDFSLTRLNNVIENLIVYPKNIRQNLNKLQGLHYSQNLLLALIDRGVSREEAYANVQKCAMQTWKSIESKKPLNFYNILVKNKHILNFLSKKEIKKIFSNDNYVKHTNHIFRKVFKD